MPHNPFSKKEIERQARKVRQDTRGLTVNVKLIKEPDVYGVRFSPKGKRDKFIPEL